MQKAIKGMSVVTLLSLIASGCGEAWLNQTASLGGGTAGDRGSIGVVVLNNTPYRAVMTLGSYDQGSESFSPDVQQYTLSGSQVLDGESDGGFLEFECARVVSLGGSRFLEAIDEAGIEDLDEAALIEGIEFFQVDEDDAEGEPVSQGMAGPFEVLLGVDFPCNSLLIFKLEVNDSATEPFRVDFELIPSSDSR